MANNAVINNIYNYYLTTYAPKTDTKFDTHKKSELRGVYNSIVKMNKDDPLFIVDKSQSTKEYAVGLKENARAFRNTIASLGGLDEDEMLNQRVAYSSDESVAEAVYIGEGMEGEAPSFELEVRSLATSQVNTGYMVSANESVLPEDTYSFDIAINGLNYEFQYNVYADETNKTIQDKLSRLISNANIGLSASVVEDGNGNSALRIESQNTGSQGGRRVFAISDNNTSKTSGTVGFFGIDRVTTENSDAQFLINGAERSASSNEFTVEKMYEIHLKGVSPMEGAATKITLQADVESLAGNIEKLIDGYNSFIDTADAYTELHPKSGRLVREMSALASLHGEELSQIGISVGDDGRIKLDKMTLQAAASEGVLKENFGALKTFTGAMIKKTNEVSLNPMKYADRTVVAYKNPGNNHFSSPYVTSAYTGMMFNSYC